MTLLGLQMIKKQIFVQSSLNTPFSHNREFARTQFKLDLKVANLATCITNTISTPLQATLD